VCSEDRTLPATDVAAAIAFAGVTSLGAATLNPGNERDFDWQFYAGEAILSSAAVAFALSAWWGFRNTARCRRAHGGD
jgi:hypothetical protein